jgi:hypothetical protein
MEGPFLILVVFGALYENHVMNSVTPISREEIEVLL